MTRKNIWRMSCVLLLIGGVLVVPSAAVAAKKTLRADAQRRQVDLFDAMHSGEIEVTLIPKDSTESNVLLRNKTAEPLSIRLPATFAGVPVLAQVDDFGGGGGGFGGGGGMGQSMGGGMGGMGGMGGGDFGGGFFNVAPEKVGKLTVSTVCLEHGKPDPNPRMKYQLVPLDSYTKNSAVHELCALLGTGRIDQAVAQAAAWNLANGLSWQQLAAKVGIRHLNGTSEPYFRPQQIQQGMLLAAEAQRRAAAKGQPSDEKADSLSRND